MKTMNTENKTKYQNQDIVDKLEEIVSELDYRLNDGRIFSEKEVEQINQLCNQAKEIMASLLPLQIRKG